MIFLLFLVHFVEWVYPFDSSLYALLHGRLNNIEHFILTKLYSVVQLNNKEE